MGLGRQFDSGMDHTISNEQGTSSSRDLKMIQSLSKKRPAQAMNSRVTKVRVWDCVGNWVHPSLVNERALKVLCLGAEKE